MPKILENVADDILQASRDLILSEGYSNLSIKKISLKCGIATGTIYNYFDSKDEILICIIKREWTILLRKIDSINKNNTYYIDSLREIYHEVKYFMNIVHSFHLDNFSGQLSHDKYLNIKSYKKRCSNELIEKIKFSVKELYIPEENIFVYDIISNIFFSYSIDENITFDDLIPFIEKLLH